MLRKWALTPDSDGASRAGIAMPAVLGTLVVSALLASAVAHLAQDSYKLTVAQHRMESDEWVLQAGLNRAVAALITPGDAMRETLFSGRSMPWTFGEVRVSLEMSRESEKIDLNAAAPELVMSGISLALPRLSQEEKAHVMARLAKFRAYRQSVLSPELLLPLDQRSSSISDQLRRSTTTLTGQTQPSATRPDSHAEDGLTGGAMFSSRFADDSVGPQPRPIYRLTATIMKTETSSSGSVPLTASVVVVLSVNDPRTFKIAEGHL